MSKYDKYIKAWHDRRIQSAIEVKQLAQTAEIVAEKCADILLHDFGAQKVFLFGSLAIGYFRKKSDIDLVVKGLAKKKYFKALCKITEAAKDFDIDLIPFEDYRYKEEVLELGILFDEQRKKWKNSPLNLLN